MSQPLRNTKVGRSEFDHGSGMVPHPDSDYQTFRKLPFATLEDKNMEWMRMDSGSPYRLYGRGIRWGIAGRRERFVLCGGESRCIWTRTKLVQETGATSFRESSAASDSYWSDSGSLIRKVKLRGNWQDSEY
jgi:hypothetical protein